MPVIVRPLVTVVPDRALRVQWTGQQAVVTLPEHLGHFNADQVREQLLWVINRGVTVLIADLTGTVSCDYSGAEALARAQQRAIANGAELRLVASGDVVRRVLSLNSFDRLVSVYPDLDGAIAAGADSRELDTARQAQIEGRAARAEELLVQTVDTIFSVGLILNAALDQPPDVAAQHIADALGRLDDAVREIRNDLFAERGHGAERPGAAGPSAPGLLERSALARNQSLLLRKHVAQTARSVQSTAAETAALLDRRSDFLGWHTRIDYPTEVKRWRALADQAGQIADRWEQP